MRRWMLTVCPFVLACSVDSVVAEGAAGAEAQAGQPGTASSDERSSGGRAGAAADEGDDSGAADAVSVTKTVQTGCVDLCTIARSCPDWCGCEQDLCDCSSNAVFEDCTAHCYEGFMEAFTGRGQEGLTRALTIFTCTEAMTCEGLASGTDACGQRFDAVASSDVCGYAYDTGGGETVAPGTVGCMAITGVGELGYAEPDGGTAPARTTCTGQWFDCDDGHMYDLECTPVEGRSSCTCMKDQGERRRITVNADVCAFWEAWGTSDGEAGDSLDDTFTECGWPVLRM